MFPPKQPRTAQLRIYSLLFYSAQALVSTVDPEKLSAALGYNVSVAAPVITQVARTRTETTVVSVEVTCPAGKWCSAGYTVDCTNGTYNPVGGADSATACLVCPTHTTTHFTGASNITDCVCSPGRVALDDKGTCGCPENTFYSSATQANRMELE
jgi:hypothetical protein